MTDTPTPDPDLRDFIERAIGYYLADSQVIGSTVHRIGRREGQIITLAEVLRFMDGSYTMSDQLAELVPVTLKDLPRRLGGTT